VGEISLVTDESPDEITRENNVPRVCLGISLSIREAPDEITGEKITCKRKFSLATS
jgi:hypothetical protein